MSPSDDGWDLEADAVIVGFGGSGAAAAITVVDNGGTVLILEKQERAEHAPSSALLSGASMFVTNVQQAAQYMHRCAAGLTPYEVSLAWASKAFDLRAWMNALAPEQFRMGTPVGAAEHPDFYGSEAIVKSNGVAIGEDGAELPARGDALFRALTAAVERRDIRVEFGARVTGLVQTGGRVEGVEYVVDGLSRRVRAGRGVILATGGFEFNDEFKRQYLPVRPVHFYAGQASTGDGIVLAQALGADLWHMNVLMGRAVGHFVDDAGKSIDVAIYLNPLDGSGAGYVITDRYGRRFTNEQSQARMEHSFFFEMIAFDPHRGEFPRAPSYWFFDERRRKGGPLTQVEVGAAGRAGFRWSADNAAEIERGWISCGATVAEAAGAAGVADPTRAEIEVHAYNEACRRGSDVFGRDVETLIPLDEPPYYCVAVWPGGLSTTGGPRRNEYGQVVHVSGSPIAGLYSAGELGSNMGALYPGGSAYYSDVLCSGRIAGESVMRIKS